MADDPRVKLIEDAFGAFQERNVEGLIAFLHPEVESRVDPPLLNAGSWRGLEGFAEMVAGWEEAFGQITYDIRDMDLVDERNVLVEVHQSGTGAGSGVPVALDVYFLIEIVGEQTVRFQIHADRESALAAI